MDNGVADEEIASATGEHLRSVAVLCGVSVPWPHEPDDVLRARIRSKRARDVDILDQDAVDAAEAAFVESDGPDAWGNGWTHDRLEAERLRLRDVLIQIARGVTLPNAPAMALAALRDGTLWAVRAREERK
jgi:hypothetical protein